MQRVLRTAVRSARGRRTRTALLVFFLAWTDSHCVDVVVVRRAMTPLTHIGL